MKVLITGSGSGIGKAILDNLTAAGHDVIGISGKSECDVSNREAVKTFCTKLRTQNFIPNVVVLNAGIFPNDIDPNFNRAELDRVIAVNLGGALNFIEELLPDMIERGSGHFIGISSFAAFRPNLRGIGYSASKAALALTLRGFNMHYSDLGIKFSTVYLGPTATNMWEGEKSFFVATPNGVAKAIEQLIKSQKSVIYYPFLASCILKLLMLCSDDFYIKIRKHLIK